VMTSRTIASLSPLHTLHVALLATTLATFFLGCSSSPKRDATDAREFPISLVRTEVLDVQVVRETTHIRATNTSPRSFQQPTTLWINRRFSRPIGAWAIGQTITLDLRDFRDNFGERFRAGGFFAAERPDNVVLAELETPSVSGSNDTAVLIGLVVAQGKAE